MDALISISPSRRSMAIEYLVRECKNGTLYVLHGQVGKEGADLIVTPANNRLSGREGLDAVVHKAAGPKLMEACRELAAERRAVNQPPCFVGEARTTEAFDLDAKHVVHVVAPDCRRPNQDNQRKELLQKAYTSLFTEIVTLGAKTVAAPALSMGIFAYPHREGARMTFETILKWLEYDAPEDFEAYRLYVDEANFISNMRTIYREEEDQFPGIHMTGAS